MKRLCLAVSLLLASSLPARADDWAVKRSPFDQRLVGRYKALLEKRPNDGYAMARLLKLYRHHRTVGELVREYQRKVGAKPKSFALRLLLGHLHRRTGALDAAEQQYRKASELRPKSAMVAAALGDLYRKRGDDAAAVTAYERARDLARSTRDKKRYLRALANMAVAARDIKATRKYFAELLKLDPNNIVARMELARALSKTGSHDEAIAEYKMLLERSRDTATRVDLLKQIGAELTATGKHDQAIATYRRAMSLAARGHWVRRELTDRIIAIHRKKDDLKGLIAYYERHWKHKGAFEHETLGRLYDETGDEARALAAYEQALKRTPQSVDIRVRTIALLERAGHDKEVIAQYRKLARIAPGEPRHQLELAKRLHRTGDREQALKVLERCGQRFASDASVHAALADLYARWGDHKRALRQAQVLVRIEPRDQSHLVNLGEQYFLQGKKRKALETWKRLLATIPQRHQAYAKLAAIYAQHDMTQQALVYYRKAIKLSPKTLAYHRGLALLLEQKRLSRDAIRTWEEVLSLAAKEGRQQTRREARTHIINIQHRTYQLRSEIRAYRVRFDAGDIESGFFLAEAHIKRRSLHNAAKVYRRILQMRPDNIEALTALEATYRRQRKLASAVELLKRLAQLQPKNAREYYQRIANLQLQLYKDKEALEYAHKAVAMGAQDARSYQRLGELYEKKEDSVGALRAYRKAIELNPAAFAVRFAIARLHSRRGEYDKAEQIYRRVLRTARTPEVLRKAFRQGVELSAYLGRLEQMEKEIHPLAVTAGTTAPVYRELLVELYHRRVPPLMHQARHGDAKTRVAAREALRRIGVRGMAPLLEQLASADSAPGRRRQLIRLLGYLGNANAALPLLRLAEKEPEERPVTIRGTRSYRSYPYSGYRSSSGAARRVSQRLDATVGVGRLADAGAVPGLIRLLANREGALRDAAAWALARIDSRQGKRALFKALGDRRSTVQMMACAGLGLGSDATLRPVLEEVMLDTTRNVRVRAACAWGLGALGDGRALTALNELLHAGDDELQRAAAWALGALADGRAIEPLVRSLWNKRSAVRRAVVWALLQTVAGKRYRVDSIPDVVITGGRIDADQFVDRLTAAVDELESRALASRLPRLVRVHEVAIAQGLRAALARHRDVVLRVLRDLDRDPKRLALGPLTSGIDLLGATDRDDLTRSVAAVGRRLTAAVAPLLAHGDPLVRERAISVYAKLRLPDFESRVTKVLGDPSWRVRIAAVHALAGSFRRGDIARAAAVRLARQPLRSPRWREREAAVGLLAALHHPDASPLLVVALRDLNGFVREAAARALALALFSDSQATDALLHALSDDVSHVRAAAAEALGARRVRRAAARLRRLAADPSPRVRQAAARALEKLR